MCQVLNFSYRQSKKLMYNKIFLGINILKKILLCLFVFLFLLVFSSNLLFASQDANLQKRRDSLTKYILKNKCARVYKFTSLQVYKLHT